jgi:hypothetical protein
LLIIIGFAINRAIGGTMMARSGDPEQPLSSAPENNQWQIVRGYPETNV